MNNYIMNNITNDVLLSMVYYDIFKEKKSCLNGLLSQDMPQFLA
jgi:hypothetical protein